MRGHDTTEQPSRIRRSGLGGRRVPRGPWPARPAVVPVGVRPVQPTRPPSPPVVRRSSALALLGSSLLGARRPAEQRVLARRALPLSPAVPRAHRLLAAAALAVATATAVVLLGLLAGAVAQSRL